MKYLTAFLFTALLASAYMMPPDQVIIDGRILRTGSRPLDTFAWPGERPRLSEHPQPGYSDSRELEALWAIENGRLYLLTVSAFRMDGFAGRSVGLRELMPERIREGKVWANWFTGNFDVLEPEQVNAQTQIRPENAPPMHVTVRRFHVAAGQVTEAPHRSP
jgi:hypothetical protein